MTSARPPRRPRAAAGWLALGCLAAAVAAPLYLFEDLSGLPLLGVPIVNHDNNQHAPDENLRIGNLWYGIDLMAALLTMPAEPGSTAGAGE